MTETITRIEVGLIDPSPFQTRRFNGSSDLKELAASIENQGVLQPILVRSSDGGRYELMAGERRLRASKKLDLANIPAIVMEVNDAEACAICVSENFQREDLHPIEEGEAIALMLTQYTIKEAAARLGRSQSFVARRAQINSLTDSWRKFAKKHLPSWGVLHFEVVSKVPPEVQEVVLANMTGWDDKYTVSDIERVVQRQTRRMDYAIWDESDNTLHPAGLSCVACPDRSAKNPMLFGRTKKGEPDFCLNGLCFAAKQGKFIERAYTQACERYAQEVIKVSTSYGNEEGVSHHDLPGRMVDEYEEGFTAVFVIDGPDAGQVKFVDFPTASAVESAKVGKKGKSWDEKEEGLRRRRYKRALLDVVEAIEESEAVPSNDELLALVGYMGVSWGHTTAGKSWSYMEDAPTSDLADHIERFEDRRHDHTRYIWREGMLPLVRKRLKYEPKSNIDNQWTEAVIFASLAGIDADQIMVDAVAAVPEPKSWAKQRAPA